MNETSWARAKEILLFVALAGGLLVALGATVLQRDRGVDAPEMQRIEEVLDVDAGEVVADVGAGDGRFAEALAEIVGPRGLVYATEVDPDDIERIEDRVREGALENVVVVTGNERDTRLPEACCHAILLRRVYHHFTDPASMRTSLRRSLRRDGLLLVIDFENRRSWARPNGIPASREGHGISKELLRSEMERAGFEVVADMEWRGGDYALLFRVARVTDP